MEAQKPKIIVIDYGVGNQKSVAAAFRSVGCDAKISSSSNDILDADGICLPGVGAFPIAMQNLTSGGFLDVLSSQVLDKDIPFLGICLGMQLLAKTSEEYGLHNGFGWIEGSVHHFEPSDDYRVPHVGWNSISIARSTPLLEGIEPDRNFYFTHSYYLKCPDSYVINTTNYIHPFVSGIQHRHIFGVQFHPENSSANGLRMLNNFASYAAQRKGHTC